MQSLLVSQKQIARTIKSVLPDSRIPTARLPGRRVRLPDASNAHPREQDLYPRSRRCLRALVSRSVRRIPTPGLPAQARPRRFARA